MAEEEPNPEELAAFIKSFPSGEGIQQVPFLIPPHIKGGGVLDEVSELFGTQTGVEICHNKIAEVPGSNIFARYAMLGTTQRALCTACNAPFDVEIPYE